MAFQTRGSNPLTTRNQSDFSSSVGWDHLVDQITQAVREKLITQGVPTAPATLSPPPQAASQPAAWQHLVQHGASRIGHTGDTPFQPHQLQEDTELAAKIDHTLLKPDATPEELKRICDEARQHHFATVCVNSSNVGLAAQYLKGSDVKPIAVVGFPLGASASATKAFEAREAVRVGAQEIDMVINIGALKGKDYALVLEDIRQVVEASKPYGVKVILETANLTEDEKIIGCALSKAAGAAFVKTSTGFGSGGATAEDIALMRRVVGPEMGVKASGGIRTYDDASKMIAAGASRIGASASVAIVTKTARGTSAEKDTSSTGKNSSKKPFKTSLY